MADFYDDMDVDTGQDDSDNPLTQQPLNYTSDQGAMYPGARPGFGLQDAYANYLSNRQTATPGGGAGLSSSPLSNAIGSAKKAAIASLDGVQMSDDEKTQVQAMMNDPTVSLKDFESATRMIRERSYQTAKTAAKQPTQHDFDSPTTQQGSISISRGDGPDAMSQADYDSWIGRLAQDAPAKGETETQNDGATTFSGGALNTQNPNASDPMVALYNSVKDRLTPEQQAQWKAAANAGVNPQQLDSLTKQMTAPGKSAAQPDFNKQTEQARFQINELTKQMHDLMGQDLLHFSTPRSQQSPAFKEYTQLKQQRDSLMQSLQGPPPSAAPAQVPSVTPSSPPNPLLQNMKQQATVPPHQWQEGQILKSPSTGRIFKIVNGQPVEITNNAQ